MTSPSKAPQATELLRVIRTVRRRWRLRTMLKGLALFLAAGLAAVFLAVFGMDRFHYSEQAVRIFRVLTWVGLGALGIRFLVLPLLRRVSDEEVALYVEEHEPELEEELIGAVELSRSPEHGGASRQLIDGLVASAIERCRMIDFGVSIERRSLQRLASGVAAIAGVAMMAILLSPAFLQHGALLLFVPWKGDVAAANPYQILVAPGTVAIARGSDQAVEATLVGFDSQRVELAARRGDGEWQRWPMGEDEGGEDGQRVALLFDLQQPTEYFVESEGVRSPLFRIDVTDIPYVETLAIELSFPPYTGLDSQLIEDGGDITALAGSKAQLRIVTTVAISGGRVTLESAGEDAAIDLSADEQGQWLASLEIERDDFYRIELQAVDGQWHSGSPEYAIQVVEDQKPIVTFREPGRDLRTNKLDEVFTEARVEDDYGIAELSLVYSVNGGEEKRVRLARPASREQRELVAGHTFYLEELALEDGDFVSYFAEASDNAHVGGSQTVRSDIYFIEVTPFTKNYRQADQGGGMGMGGQMDNALSRRQREIVAATFKLDRDRWDYSQKELEENLTTVGLMQERLREQVDELTQRMENRLRNDEDFTRIIENLKLGSQEMVPAEEALAAFDAERALGPEQRALKFLQRAEAIFREVQVAFQSGGMGGASEQMAEDLADLFELELDKMHNQYETVERGQRQELQQEIDEALEKLKELARRQQQENERKARANQQMGSGGGAAGQRELVEQTEELARRLEKLSREQSRPDLQESARRLQEAANSMRDAMSRSGAGGTTRQGIAALEELERARRLLEKNREFELASELDDLQERGQRVRQMQQSIEEGVSRLGEAGSGAERERQLQQILEQKDELGREVDEIEGQLDRSARQSRESQRDASRRLGEAADSIRGNQLKEKIRYSKGVVGGRSADYAQRFEEQIRADIEEMGDKIDQAQEAMGVSEQSQVADSLDRTRELVRGLESLQSRLEDGAQRGSRQGERGEEGERQGEGQAQGQQGQQGQGQPGQQGQQGQQGQESGAAGQQGSGESGAQPGGKGREQGAGEPGESRQASGEPGGQEGDAAQGGRRTRLGPGSVGGFQPGVFTPEEIRQMAGEFDQRRRQGEELSRNLDELGVSTADLDEVLRRMRDFDIRDVNRDPLALDELRSEIVDGLKHFEFRVWRELRSEGDADLHLAGGDAVPAGYRESVERYFKALSEGG